MGEKIAVLGATGYVGSRLVGELLKHDLPVVATSRQLKKLEKKSWAENPLVEIREADGLDYGSLVSALEGCTRAYYFIHSMNAQSRDFAADDRHSAKNMVRAAEEVGLKQIIYLGGLGDNNEMLSKHLQSRAEVSEILHTGSVPVTTLRAAMIIGSGSASFEILRYLVERLPIMVTPKWVSIVTQPVSIRNTLEYLVGCVQNEETIGKSFDIGGPEVLTYRELMRIYAEEAGLTKRFVIPVPVFTPKLSSYWIHLVTPVPSYLARPLAEGLRNPTVCQDKNIRNLIPQELLSCRDAIRLALDRTQHQTVQSHWTDAGKIWPVAWSNDDDAHWAGGTVFEDRRSIVINASKENVWQRIVRIGGKTGYYYGNWLWRIRGIMDKLFGGVGLRRGRRDEEELNPGDALDFWRVKEVVKCSRLVLVAEMKLPGEAVLRFHVKENEDGSTELTQVAKFLPKGLLGLAYWYLVTPLHDLVFNGMLNGIANATGKDVKTGPNKVIISKEAVRSEAMPRPLG